MGYTIPPACTAIIKDANRVAPGRSRASDGTIGDLRHQAQGSKSDHNPDANGIVHAVDITNDPAHGMDTWKWAQTIAARMVAGLERRVEYLVSNDGKGDVIFHPAVSNTWRRQSSTGNEHANHLHTSIRHTAAAENDTTQYFVDGAAPAKQTDAPAITNTTEDDTAMFIFNGEPHEVWVDANKNLWHHWPHGTDAPLARGKVKFGPTFNDKVDPDRPIEFMLDPVHPGVIYGQVTNTDGWLIVCVYLGGWDVTPVAPQLAKV